MWTIVIFKVKGMTSLYYDRSDSEFSQVEKPSPQGACQKQPAAIV